MAASSEERIAEPVKEATHKTKLIQFLGRTTPIILQNDNGPCPLLAICNVLLLKNNINLNSDMPEVSQEKLLSLVAERLIDSNSNVSNKDAAYVENQQQNIADAIDLLPRLTTGIDVNIKFKEVSDFEFTRECAIFDLLDIPLYHGWIVDPQDSETYNAIGSKSYNTIMGELVALETRSVSSAYTKEPEEESVDFVAATTATLGVPSPSLSRGLSFEDSSGPGSEQHKAKKGDLEEEAELLRALKLSEAEFPTSSKDNVADSSVDQNVSLCAKFVKSEPVVPAEIKEGKAGDEIQKACQHEPSISDESAKLEKSELVGRTEIKEGDAGDEIEKSCQHEPSNSDESAKLEKSERVVPTEIREGDAGDEIQRSCQHESSISDDNHDVGKNHLDLITFDAVPEKDNRLSSKKDQNTDSQISCKESELNINNNVSEKTSNSFLEFQEAAAPDSHEADPLCTAASSTDDSGGAKLLQNQSALKLNVQEGEDKSSDGEKSKIACSTADAGLDPSGGSSGKTDVSEDVAPSGDDTEPIYEGEEYILEAGDILHDDQEAVYEGEVVLAEEVAKNTGNASDVGCKNELSPKQGELIKDFLRTNASQLTIFGLFRLQEKLKDRELCVFFRNNHFNTMFKYEGQLYLLATDQGYINQPDLVWERLNEVNGNTEFMTGTFKEFKAEEDHASNTWDEQNARATTADYLASIDNPAQDISSFNSDLQLAIALQQQEFEEPPQRNTQQQNVGGASRLVTGPQSSRSSNSNSSSSSRNYSSSSKPDSKAGKDKCIVM